jgi:hypothetical protein
MDNMITLRPVILESDLSIGVGNVALGAKGLVVHVRGTIVSPNEEALVATFDTPSLVIPDIEHDDTVLAQLRRQGKQESIRRMARAEGTRAGICHSRNLCVATRHINWTLSF